MALREPESMDECIYFTRRIFDNGKGKAMAWVFRKDCPKCGKEQMHKPQGDDGHVKVGAKEYQGHACSHTVPKDEYEPTLTCDVKYTCSGCGKSGEASVPFKRVSFQGVKAVGFRWASCGQKIGITKKLADGKKKKVAAADAESDDDE